VEAEVIDIVASAIMYSSSSSRSKQTYHNRGSLFRSNGSNSVTVMNQFVSGLKSKNEETRCKAARDLYHYVCHVTYVDVGMDLFHLVNILSLLCSSKFLAWTKM